MQSHVEFYPQETAQLEADVFVQRQKVALASEVKSVLDSWVRFEQQAKENEQAELAKSVITKVLSTVSDERTQREILNGAVAEVERKYQFSYILWISVY
jgi:F-type H+-transporting ATPase subunit b